MTAREFKSIPNLPTSLAFDIFREQCSPGRSIIRSVSTAHRSLRVVANNMHAGLSCAAGAVDAVAEGIGDHFDFLITIFSMISGPMSSIVKNLTSSQGRASNAGKPWRSL